MIFEYKQQFITVFVIQVKWIVIVNANVLLLLLLFNALFQYCNVSHFHASAKIVVNCMSFCAVRKYPWKGLRILPTSDRSSSAAAMNWYRTENNETPIWFNLAYFQVDLPLQVVGHEVREFLGTIQNQRLIDKIADSLQSVLQVGFPHSDEIRIHEEYTGLHCSLVYNNAVGP